MGTVYVHIRHMQIHPDPNIYLLPYKYLMRAGIEPVARKAEDQSLSHCVNRFVTIRLNNYLRLQCVCYVTYSSDIHPSMSMILSLKVRTQSIPT